MSVAKEIYDDTASFGRIWALISAIIASIMGLAAIIGGIYILARKSSPSGTVGTVIKVNGDDYGECRVINTGNNIINYSCVLTVRYTLNGVETDTNVSYFGPVLYMVGSSINIDGHGGVIDKGIPKWAGGLMIFMGFVVAGGAWFWYWAARNYKPVAAASGVGGMLNMIRG